MGARRLRRGTCGHEEVLCGDYHNPTEMVLPHHNPYRQVSYSAATRPLQALSGLAYLGAEREMALRDANAREA